ncbi:gene transfer agent family protein [Qipengyuania sp. RANM35]|uniref:gene transfer agent family protein n=1 Tax=Qipengyuania sp. RANM35 TaxID=3068635 RepID=UPI0034DAD54E
MNRAQVAEGGSAEKAHANQLRGEATISIDGRLHLLRPSFDALVRAEEELGPLFAMVERAGEGQLRLSEIAALFWHCLAERGELTREQVGSAVLATGLAEAAKPLRALLGEILKGSG